MTTTTEIKPLPPRFLAHTAEYDVRNFFLKLSIEYSYSDLFTPGFWTHHAQKLKRYDMIRVADVRGTFDVLLTVANTAFGEPVMKFYAGHPPPPEAQHQKLVQAEEQEAA